MAVCIIKSLNVYEFSRKFIKKQNNVIKGMAYIGMCETEYSIFRK